MSNTYFKYLDITAFIFLGNRYVLTGMQGRLKFRDTFNYKYFNLKNILAHNILPPLTKWPIKAGNV